MTHVDSDLGLEFAAMARGFCSWCEGQSHGAMSDATAISWLAKLYGAAVSLPEVGSENSDDKPQIPEEFEQRARLNLASFNGRYYRECFDPNPLLEDDPVMGDIGDDLLDTYLDIRSGLILFERGQIAEALWHWSFLHRAHWGHHAVGAMFALHCLSISKRGRE